VISGRLITFEGIDGAGKSSHIEPLADRLRQRGLEVVVTREPGGTALAEALRELVLHQPMDALTEALIVFAARRHHLQECIEPALTRGAAVLCDRFTDASYAYQGGGRGLALGVLQQLESWVQQGRQPDLTLWFDLPAEVAAARRAQARSADRFEAEDAAFFGRVRHGYLQRSTDHAERFARIDASADFERVHHDVIAAIAARPWW
jgi:dTMP kinase